MAKATRKGWKRSVPRHRKMCRASANALEKQIETFTRRQGKKACEERD